MTPTEMRALPSLRRITAETARVVGLHESQLLGRDKSRFFTRPRQMAMYLACELTAKSLPTIGRWFNRHHSTVIHARCHVRELMRADERFARRVRAIEFSILYPAPDVAPLAEETTMGKPRLKTPAHAERVPQTREEVDAAIAEIGQHTRERLRIETAMNDELAVIKARFEELAQPHSDAMRARLAGVQTWCEAHRDELTQGGKVKTAAFPSGEVRWRANPPSVAVRSVDTVLKALWEKGLSRFVRVKEEVNKEAILAEPDAVKGIPGITIKAIEEFAVVPFEAALDAAQGQ